MKNMQFRIDSCKAMATKTMDPLDHEHDELDKQKDALIRTIIDKKSADIKELLAINTKINNIQHLQIQELNKTIKVPQVSSAYKKMALD